jgi:hypothetical protein
MYQIIICSDYLICQIGTEEPILSVAWCFCEHCVSNVLMYLVVLNPRIYFVHANGTML